MTIDCHYHYYATEFNPDEKLREMDVLGIDRIQLIAPICLPFPAEPEKLPMRFMRLMEGKRAAMPLMRKLLCTFHGDGIDILGFHAPIFFFPKNEAVFRCADAHPDRFGAYVTLNPNRQSVEEICSEVEKWSHHTTFAGIKVHPFYHQYSAEKLEICFQLLRGLDRPLLVHMGFDDREPILALSDRYPEVNVILAHTAFPFFDQLWPEIAQRKNIFTDISSGCYVDAKIARRAVDTLGADRVLYGSDGPHGALREDKKFDMQQELDFVKALLTHEEWEQIGCKNAQRLFHLN